MEANDRIIICDSSVLINFLKIGRLDLFEAYSCDFFVTDHVRDEITDHYPDQKQLFEASLRSGIMSVISVTDPCELELFAKLGSSGQLGAGECSAIAVASIRGYKIAIEDNQAIKKALSLIPNLEILRTQDLLRGMVLEGVIEIDAVDVILQTWAAKHRFKIKMESIREILR
jgi:predicted nucleic acid-binding protein